MPFKLWLNLPLLMFSILLVSVFFGLYRPVFLTFTSIPSFLFLILEGIIIGLPLFLFFRQGLIYLYKFQTINCKTLKNLHRFKYSIFILSIFLLSMIFSYQAISNVNSNSYAIDSRSVTVSDDFTEIAYIVFHNTLPYLVIRNLQNKNSVTMYSLINIPCTDFFDSSKCKFQINSDYTLKFFMNKNIILITGNSPNSYSYMFYISQQKITEVFNLNNNEFYGTDYLYLDLSSSNVRFTSTLYNTPNSSNSGLIYLFTLTPNNYFNISKTILLPNITLASTLPSQIDKNTIDYSFSEDLTKLAFLYFTAPSIMSLNFYNINNNSSALLANQSFAINNFNSFQVHLIKWSSDFSKFFYSYDNGNSTFVDAFNFSNSSIYQVCKLSGSYTIVDIDDSASFIVGNQPFAVYEVQNPGKKIKDLQNTDAYFNYLPVVGYYSRFEQNFIWDATGTKFVQITTTGAIYISSYDYKSNSVQGPYVVDANITPSDINNLEIIAIMDLILILAFFIRQVEID